MKRILMLISSCIALFMGAQTDALEYSLDDLYRIALERSETLKIAEDDLYISELQKDKARSILFPVLSAFGYHTRYSEEKRQAGVLLQPEYTNEWGLRFGQSYSLSGREFTELSIAGEGIKKSRFDLSATQEEYLFTVSSHYFILLRSKREVEIARANITRLTKQRDAAKKRLEVGEVTKTVLLRAEAELTGAQTDLIRAENNVRLARTRLARTVGISGEYEVREPLLGADFNPPEQGEPDLSFLTENCQMPELDCLKERALTERAEIKSSSVQRDIADEQIKVAKGSYWPDLGIEGVYLRQENSPSTSFGLSERTYGALKLEFPFFEGGLKKAEVGEARARKRQAELGYRDLSRSIAVEVENAYLIIIREAAVLKQTEAELVYASDNYNLISRQFQYGLADSLDVIDANTLLVTAERENTNAAYAYQLALLGLKRATGTLLKEVLSNKQPALEGKKTE